MAKITGDGSKLTDEELFRFIRGSAQEAANSIDDLEERMKQIRIQERNATCFAFEMALPDTNAMRKLVDEIRRR